ncbi:hypothetical protein [Ferrimicrobium sp.]|uniref:hypothetical protein n=1 Tax=Ferrimicrobium sp. TaxID=2926050 RepID=UPI002618D479|nr:hypothetical protein [Ferrimicrobium sp.]
MTASSSSVEPATVRFGRQSTRGVLLGFSLLRVVALGLVVIVVVAALTIAGETGFVLSGLLWVPLLASAMVSVQGRPAIEWVPVAGHYWARKHAGQTEFRSKPSKP